MLYVFVGARDQRLREAVQIALGRPQSDDMAYSNLDGAEASLDELVGACATFAMFGGRRKVFLENAQILAARNAKLFGWLAAFAGQASDSGAPDSCDLAVAAYIDLGDRRSSGRATKFQALKQAGAQVKEFRPLRGREVLRFIQQRAQTQGVRITADAAGRLAELVTADAGLLASEVDKLITYAGFSGTIDIDAVDAASAAIGEHARWDYINAVTDRRLDRALGVLHDMLALRAPHQMVLSDIATSVRRLALAKQALDEGGGLAEVVKSTGVPESRARQLLGRARQISDRLLQRMYAEVVRTDLALKSTGGDNDALLEILTARLAARPVPRRSA